MIKINCDKALARKLPHKKTMKQWVAAALTFLQSDVLAQKTPIVYIDFVDIKTIRTLNLQYRQKDYATNVLSFEENIPLPQRKLLLGNVILSAEVIAKEAIEQEKPFEDHLAHMLIHGCLHLLKYDHEKSSDARAMEALEIKILDHLGIQNPYE